MPSANATGHELGRRGRGSPESEDLPVALHTEPLAEGGFVLRRLVALLALSLVLAPAASAARVLVRVEGKTTTIFGPQYVAVNATNAMDALEQASLAGEFYYHVTTTSFGPYVDQIGRYGSAASTGWVFKVGGAAPPVGADKVTLKDGDTVLWYYAEFGGSTGPPTLAITRSAGCYTVVAQDDNGKNVSVAGVVLHVGSKRTLPVTLGKAICNVGKHAGLLLRATAAGAVRSNAIA
jgi:hypothetical protein